MSRPIFGQTTQPLDSRVIEIYNAAGSDAVLDAPYAVKARPPKDLEDPDALSDLFVADTANNRIIKFPGGDFDRPVYYPNEEQARLLTGDGKEEADLNVAINRRDPNVDDKALAYARTKEDRRLFKPMGVAFTHHPNHGDLVLVADTGNGRVVALKEEKNAQTGAERLNYLWAFGYFNDNGLIRDIETDGEGFIYLLDSRHGTVAKYTLEGKPTPFHDEQYVVGNLDIPYDMEVAGDRIYVADTTNHQIVEYATGGQLLGAIGSKGKATDTLFYPQGVAVGAYDD